MDSGRLFSLGLKQKKEVAGGAGQLAVKERRKRRGLGMKRNLVLRGHGWLAINQ